jgi:hypothetical protein
MIKGEAERRQRAVPGSRPLKRIKDKLWRDKDVLKDEGKRIKDEFLERIRAKG